MDIGYCSIEWCQKTQKDYDNTKHPDWDGPSSYAFIMEDFQLFNQQKQPLDDITGLTLDDILYVKIRFRKQKNDRKYEIIPHYKDLENPAF